MKRLLLLGIIGAFVIPSLAGSQVPRFTDHSDETVTDNVTGLMWQQEDDDVRRDWEDALVYCEELDLAGYTDWRLPDVGELRSIVDNARNNPAIDTAYFPGTNPISYWSSSTSAYNAYQAWTVFFCNDSIYGSPKTYGLYVRCVRWATGTLAIR